MNTEKRRKILSIVVPLLFLMAGLFYWARFMRQTPANIVPSTELLTSDLSSLRFNFEGHELRFPLTVREFKETTKWGIKDNGDQALNYDEVLEPHTYVTNSMTAFYSSNRHVFFRVENDTDEAKHFLDCKLVQLTFHNNNSEFAFWRRSCTLILPKGIRMASTSSTREEIIAAYGEPTDSDTRMLEYAFDNYTVTFLFTPTPNKLLLVKFECLDSFLQDE
jgi:hypothetical protein